MVKRVAVVTGANKGIGLAIVRNLCGNEFDGDVILTARDCDRGKAAVEALSGAGLNPIYHRLDITDAESVEELTGYLRDNYSGVDVLVNSAAIAYGYGTQTAVGEQASRTMGTNFYGTRRLCRRLLPIMRPNGRLVNLTSTYGVLTSITDDGLRRRFLAPDLSDEQLMALADEYVTDAREGRHVAKGWPKSTYIASKVFVTALTRVQQRQLDADGTDRRIVANAVNPGVVPTDLNGHRGHRSPDEGADAATYLALLPPHCDQPSGALVWWDRRVVDWA
ncbi:unnamed protein product [Oppiella nova]|uniref:Carbonyl reductase n=1 Tax=Oppiella nova TaxID=334625 RepID=A0A7R9MIB2_9ACAR|nr:unnamed protein product [Oppiella nova]CAG2176738.1 unnamed protein product [Oppiella nova]